MLGKRQNASSCQLSLQLDPYLPVNNKHFADTEGKRALVVAINYLLQNY